MLKRSLSVYKKKRDFGKTPEPSGRIKLSSAKELSFVIQKHAARRLHYDFRLEVKGVLKSWAVPKGPSLNPSDRRLAIETEDHPIEYAKFEGVIPEGNYGAGKVIVWDRGKYVNLSHDPRSKKLIPIQAALAKGQAMVWLKGEKLKGAFLLTRLKSDEEKRPWLLIKVRDKAASAKKNILSARPESVLTGLTIENMR